MKKQDYITPEIEVIEVHVEKGFAASNMENIGKEFPEVDW